MNANTIDGKWNHHFSTWEHLFRRPQLSRCGLNSVWPPGESQAARDIACLMHSRSDLEMGQIRIHFFDPDPDPPDFRIERFDLDPPRGPTRGGTGLIRSDPNLHQVTETFFCWLHLMAIHLNRRLFFTPVLVSIFTSSKGSPRWRYRTLGGVGHRPHMGFGGILRQSWCLGDCGVDAKRVYRSSEGVKCWKTQKKGTQGTLVTLKGNDFVFFN